MYQIYERRDWMNERRDLINERFKVVIFQLSFVSHNLLKTCD